MNSLGSGNKTILLLHHGDSGIRGSEICFIEAAHALAAAGFRLIVLRNHPVMDQRLKPWAAGIMAFNCPELMIEGAKTRLPVRLYFRALFVLCRQIRKWSPVLLYVNGGLPCQLSVPAGRLTGVPVVCHFHHPGIRRDYYIWLVRFADHLIYPSEYTRRHSYEKAGCAGDVVYNAVDTDLFSPAPSPDSEFRKNIGIGSDLVVVGQVGALVSHKRPHLLVHAFAKAAARVPELHLCLVGKGPLEKKLRNLVEELGLQDRVTITGFVESVVPYYQHVIDINVLASVEEGLGISVLEGSSCALPALVADSTGLRETVVDGVTGYTFIPDNEQSLTRSLLRLARSRMLRRQLGRAGRELVLEKFSLPLYHTRIVNAVDSVIRRGT